MNKFTIDIGRKCFGGIERKVWIKEACIKSSIIIYCFRFKVMLSFSVKFAMFVPKKWLNVWISVALFIQLLRQTWDHKITHTCIPSEIVTYLHIFMQFGCDLLGSGQTEQNSWCNTLLISGLLSKNKEVVELEENTGVLPIMLYCLMAPP